MKFNVGDKIRIVEATVGAMGSNGETGIVTNKTNTNGLAQSNEGFNVELKNGQVWRIGFDSKCELIKCNSKPKLIIFSSQDKNGIETTEAKALYNSSEVKKGITHKNPIDDSNSNFAIIISTMRALEVDKEIEERVINALFNKEKEDDREEMIKELKDYSIEEILEEINKRMG